MYVVNTFDVKSSFPQGGLHDANLQALHFEGLLRWDQLTNLGIFLATIIRDRYITVSNMDQYYFQSNLIRLG